MGYPSNTGELHGKLGPGLTSPLDTSYLHLCYTPDMEVALALGVPQLLARGLEAREDSSQGAHGQVGQPQLDHVAMRAVFGTSSENPLIVRAVQLFDRKFRAGKYKRMPRDACFWSWRPTCDCRACADPDT